MDIEILLHNKAGVVVGAALVSEIDGWVLDYSWSMTRKGHRRSSYAFRGRSFTIDGVKTKKIFHMHREIMLRAELITPDQQVDHINDDGLDNRRDNLRPCNPSQNHHSEPKRRGYKGRPCASSYKGVSWAKLTSLWRARIQHDGKRVHLGYFKDMLSAAMAYDEKALELYGPYARLNFPSGPQS